MILISNICLSVFDIRKNIVFIVFNITFFTFLLGRYFIYMLSGVVWYENFRISTMKHTLLLLYISLFSVWIGSEIYKLLKHKKTEKQRILNQSEKKLEYIRKFLFIGFCITFVPEIFKVIEKIIFVKQNSYIDLYVEYSTKIPYIISKLANCNFMFFLLYISTFPKKKNTIIITIIYSVYLVLTILTGERSTFVVEIILIFIYYVYRQYTFKETYITKKRIFIMLFLGVILIIFLSSYNTIRNGVKIEKFNPITQFKQFFIDQSNSVNVISYTMEYEEQLKNTNNNYTFGQTINKLKKDYEYMQNTNTKDTALYGNNLGASLSYLVLGDLFLKGNGLGTQYIAELYIDYSYLGVVIYNIILGVILIWIVDTDKENYILFSLRLALIHKIIYLPRQFAMGWLNFLLSGTTILVVILTYIVSIMINRSVEDENTLDS